MRKAFLIFLFGTIFSSPLYSQLKGDFFICYGFEFPSGGYLSLRYYPEDKIGMEIYTSAFWNIFNYGGRFNIHTSANLPHTYISIGYANISAYNLDAAYDTSNTTPMFLRRIVRGIDIGIGREVEYDFKHFSFQLGPTYILTMEDTFLNQDYEEETIESLPLFSYYLVGIQLASLPEKNPKPVRVQSK
jgi:hypothetical protein